MTAHSASPIAMATSPARPAISAPIAQAAAVTTTVTMSMAGYPCGNDTAAPDPWMLVVSAGRKETAGPASASTMATAARASVPGVDLGAARVRVSTWVIGLSFLRIGYPAATGRRRTSDG